jgi:hypothetical protein
VVHDEALATDQDMQAAITEAAADRGQLTQPRSHDGIVW